MTCEAPAQDPTVGRVVQEALIGCAWRGDLLKKRSPDYEHHLYCHWQTFSSTQGKNHCMATLSACTHERLQLFPAKLVVLIIGAMCQDHDTSSGRDSHTRVWNKEDWQRI